ncbi:MAG: DUF2290 domain-containing protein [Deltaproteobacteria bacterium]|nr:DUF2290 domain-containing protein [Deltaproteobacteria bacterium]
MVEITFPGEQNTSISMKNISYTDIYDRLKEQRAYIAIMADGAMIQMMYAFRNGKLERHRLAFFPSPHLEEFQNDPEIYLDDEVYAEIVNKNIVPFPIRFDFDNREGVCEEVVHPKSHLTLGQYRNCRIPVSSPLMPFHFIEFILRNFYDTAHSKFSNKLYRTHKKLFDSSILRAEKNIIYVQIPLL